MIPKSQLFKMMLDLLKVWWLVAKHVVFTFGFAIQDVGVDFYLVYKYYR